MIDISAKAKDLKIPEQVLRSWQDIVDLLAQVANVPAGIIMRLVDEDLEVFTSSRSRGNPYHVGDRERCAGSGLYCERVLNTRKRLHVANALEDEEWCTNPDIKLNMISYLGFPILLPDNSLFGTICILDSRANDYSDTLDLLMQKFRDMIQSQLELYFMNAVLGEQYERLSDYLQELQVLRGLIPICCSCKKIKDEEGQWHSVEKYLHKDLDADFSHTYCPVCYKKAMASILSK